MKVLSSVILLCCFSMFLHFGSTVPASGQAIFESDWFEIGLDDYAYVHHDLGGDPGDYLVFMYGKNFYGIHQANFGLAEKNNSWYGVEWLELNPSTITLYRGADDTMSQVGEEKWWEWVKLIIIRAECIRIGGRCGQQDPGSWSQDEPPQRSGPVLGYYDSNWFTMDPGQCRTKNHYLGGDPGQYLVFVYGRNPYGIHQGRYGMAEANGYWIGLHWSQLDSSSIRICRAPQDDESGHMGTWDEVRVRIVKMDMSLLEDCYDSGWFGIDPDEDIDKYHYLGETPGRYLVFLYGRNSYGIHNANFGTLEAPVGLFSHWFGAEWYKLNEDKITIRRAADDGDDIDPSSRWNEARVLIVGKPEYASIWNPCSAPEGAAEVAGAAQLTSAPNPSYDGTAVHFFVPQQTAVEIGLYDAAGRRIRTLLHGVRGPGWQTADWDGRDEDGCRVSSGNYFVRMKADGQEDVGSIVLIR